MQPTKLQQVLGVLADKGYTNEQLIQFTEELAQSGCAELIMQAGTLFSEEELAAIEACPTQSEATEKIKKLYKEKTGIEAEETMQTYYERFAEGFLEENAKEQTQTTTSSQD